ncbi:hypothetical protein PC120_g21002, partial [Phytophthora cactorum]
MGQRFSTSRESDISEADGPPSPTLSARSLDASPTSVPSRQSTANPPPSTEATALSPTSETLSTQRPTITDATLQQGEREGSMGMGDVVQDTLSSDQEPSAHQQQSDEADSLSFSRVSSTDSFPSSPLNVKADDAHPLTRRSSMSRTPAPPKLSRFRPSMDIPRSPQSSSESSLDSSSSSSDEDLVGSGEELVSDWL